MPLPPQKFREAVLQILFMSEFGPLTEETTPFMMAELKTTRREMAAAKERVKQILEYLVEIDHLIRKTSTAYDFDRISRLELSALRLGLFEILFDTAIPPQVAIAEGIRLTRKFGTNESAQFINAILDGVYQSHAASIAEKPQPV